MTAEEWLYGGSLNYLAWELSSQKNIDNFEFTFFMPFLFCLFSWDLGSLINRIFLRNSSRDVKNSRIYTQVLQKSWSKSGLRSGWELLLQNFVVHESYTRKEQREIFDNRKARVACSNLGSISEVSSENLFRTRKSLFLRCQNLPILGFCKECKMQKCRIFSRRYMLAWAWGSQLLLCKILNRFKFQNKIFLPKEMI